MTDAERLEHLFRLLNTLAKSGYDLDPIVGEIGKILGIEVKYIGA